MTTPSWLPESMTSTSREGAGEMARARKTRELAAAQLAQNGVVDNGGLTPRQMPSPDTPLALAKHRETLAVAPTRMRGCASGWRS